MYETGTTVMTLNFMFEFSNYTLLFVVQCYILNNYCQIYWKRVEFGLCKIDT